MSTSPRRASFAVNLNVDDAIHHEALETICELLAHDAHMTIEPVCAASPSEMVDVLARGDADFAWISPTLLFMSAALATMVPLLSSVRRGLTYFHSVVFSSRNSYVQGLGEIRNLRAAWVAPTSAAGYIVPRLALARNGVDLTTAFSEEMFFDSHGEVARAVFSGKADLGATYAHFEGGDSSRHLIRAGYQDAGRFAGARILAVAGPIPADMMVAQSYISIRERVAFAAALSRLAHDPVGAEPLALVIGADDFRQVSHEALTELEDLTTTACSLTLE